MMNDYDLYQQMAGRVPQRQEAPAMAGSMPIAGVKKAPVQAGSPDSMSGKGMMDNIKNMFSPQGASPTTAGTGGQNAGLDALLSLFAGV